MTIFIDKRASVLILLLLSSFLCFGLVPVVCGDGENWLGGFSYRKSHVIQNTVGAGANYQIKINVCYGSGTDVGDTVYLNGSCKSDFGDVRFTGHDGETELDYWLEEKNDSDTAVFWVEVGDDLTRSEVRIFVYYGNSLASTTSDGDATFIFFDDFSGLSINPNKWLDSGSCTVSGGIVSLNGVPETDARMDMNMNNYDEFSSPYGVSVYYRARYNTNSVRMWSQIGLRSSDDDDVAFLLYRGSLFEGIYVAKDGAYSWIDSNWDSANFHVYEEKYFASQIRCFEDGIEVNNSPLGTGNYPDDNLHLMMRSFVAEGSGVMDADFVCIRKCVESEPVHGLWGLEIGKSCTVVDFTVLDMDDADNLYAQKKYYTAQYVVASGSGATDLDYAEFSITQSSNVYANFRFDEDTKTFSIESGESFWDLDSENCSYQVSGKTITMLFMISPKFTAVEESDLDVSAFVVDEQEESDSKAIQTDYFDVVTNLVVTEFACDDDRGDVGQTLEFSGGVFYVDDPSSNEASMSYPSASAFEAVHVQDSKGVDQGSDRTLVNGRFSVTFSGKPSVDLEAYHPSIEMKDSGRVDLEEAPAVNFITDRIKILSLGAKDSRINVNDSAEIFATAEFEYDAQSLGSEDVLTIGSVDLIWNGTCFVGTDTKSSVEQKVYAQMEAKETSYGITAFNMNSHSVSVVWDRLNVQFTVKENLVPLTSPAEFTVKIFREYDNSPVQNYVYTIKRENLDISNTYATSMFTDVSDSEETRIYDFTSVVDNTYGLTAFTNPSNISVAWYPGLTQIQIIIIGAIATVSVIGLLYLWKRKKS